MSTRLEKKWRAMPAEHELQVRMEILVEEQRGLDEAQFALNAAEHGTKEYRIATQTINHFIGRVGKTKRRITRLRAGMIDISPVQSSDKIDAARARKLAQLRQNSEAMLGRFLVVTSDYNQAFLKRLGVADLAGLDVDTVLRLEGIRLVSLDNPERWSSEGHNVQPQKFMALHPTDVVPAIEALNTALQAMVNTSHQPGPEHEQAERATVVWLPKKANGWQHPDKLRTVYPPRIERLALDRSERGTQEGWAILRGWGVSLDQDLDPINGCEVDFEFNAGKNRYEALLDPDEIEEILL